MVLRKQSISKQIKHATFNRIWCIRIASCQSTFCLFIFFALSCWKTWQSSKTVYLKMSHLRAAVHKHTFLLLLGMPHIFRDAIVSFIVIVYDYCYNLNVAAFRRIFSCRCHSEFLPNLFSVFFSVQITARQTICLSVFFQFCFKLSSNCLKWNCYLNTSLRKDGIPFLLSRFPT